jgi:hypothetical protein
MEDCISVVEMQTPSLTPNGGGRKEDVLRRFRCFDAARGVAGLVARNHALCFELCDFVR